MRETARRFWRDTAPAENEIPTKSAANRGNLPVAMLKKSKLGIEPNDLPEHIRMILKKPAQGARRIQKRIAPA